MKVSDYLSLQASIQRDYAINNPPEVKPKIQSVDKRIKVIGKNKGVSARKEYRANLANSGIKNRKLLRV